MKYFDKEHYRLVFTGKKASPDFWDNRWDIKNFEKAVKNGLKNRSVVKITKNLIFPNRTKRILEGGCGNGQFVYAFDKIGYDSYGVDYAPKTIKKIKATFPYLKVSVGDVRDLYFPDDYFDGYWSIGVIEHFFDGYEQIIKEMERVIKPKGYLFISFPHLSILRKVKILLKFYPAFKKISGDEEFYEFALDHNKVIRDLEKRSFSLVRKIPQNGTKGLKDEILLLKPLLQKIYDSKNLFIRIINYGLSFILSIFSSHSILLIFRKK